MNTDGTYTPRVAVIGAGFSGLAAAVALKKRGIDDFIIFERSPGLGGTWRHNTYPGAEVDLESHIYSFSFERYDWTRTHAGWQELLAYLHRVTHNWNLQSHMRFNEEVLHVAWSDERSQYTVSTTSRIDHGQFDYVISAVGFLNTPAEPPFVREDHDFTGPICHTSKWREDLDMTGKSVGVLGTGSSAVQIVTEAEKVASAVTVFQIEPNWMLPKEARDFSPLERRLNRLAPVYAYRRLKLWVDYDLRQHQARHAREDRHLNGKRRKAALAYLHQQMADRPDLLELLVPTFPMEGRRTVISDTYYQALKNPKVRLVPHAVKGLSARGAIDANGEEHQLDMIVLATGFQAHQYLSTYQVSGENGIDLHETWADGAEAFLGMMVPGFPNFFIMFGPNTNVVPLVAFYEAQGRFAASLIARAARRGKRRVEVRPSAFYIYNDWAQNRLAKTVWAVTESYFRAGANRTGKVISQWPASPSTYIMATKLLRRLATSIK
ncbi:NAD(P)/FAD-dependent oxidoreductase [Mycolicibacterium sp. P9-64]|uniref:flavin-containing monooxygenase n=1 Tax=Mycolicibacterium sp. P9-64 TaxID=2024612 RepID=UPI0011EF5146|nr:NAD(P)/FAD-dependent oxidoreductase [Mycolicibacterium sp. P9-64]KAA0078853.1 NAD(P)/FAD-dependent oxidoreductase [Mycolicibacterium sp. P9-64]